jgi:hypothetical protein
MILRDVSTYGLYKTLLVVNIVLPLLFLPIALIVYFINPDAIHVNIDQIKFLGMNASIDAINVALYPILAAILLIQCIIVSSFQALLVKLLALYTPIGKIQLNSKLVVSNPEVFS